MGTEKPTFSGWQLRRERDGALEWLIQEGDGYPCSWDEERRQALEMRPGGECCPAIAGYEALEAEGLVERLETATREDGQERVHFRLTDAGRAAASKEDGR